MEETIRRLESEWREAILAHDLARLDSLLHAEFKLVGIRSTGKTAMPRAQWLAALPAMRFERFETEVTCLDLYRGTAVATVEGSWRLVFGDTAIDENFLLTDIWIEDPAGAWKVVRRHSSPYPRTAS